MILKSTGKVMDSLALIRLVSRHVELDLQQISSHRVECIAVSVTCKENGQELSPWTGEASSKSESGASLNLNLSKGINDFPNFVPTEEQVHILVSRPNTQNNCLRVDS
jgi:hypothetical protein